MVPVNPTRKYFIKTLATFSLTFNPKLFRLSILSQVRGGVKMPRSKKTSPLTPLRVIWAIVDDVSWHHRHLCFEWVIFSNASQAVLLAESSGITYPVAEVWIDEASEQSLSRSDKIVLYQYINSLIVGPITTMSSYLEMVNRLDRTVLPRLRTLDAHGQIVRGPIPRPTFPPIDPVLVDSQKETALRRRNRMIEFLRPKFVVGSSLINQAERLVDLVNNDIRLGIKTEFAEVEAILREFQPAPRSKSGRPRLKAKLVDGLIDLSVPFLDQVAGIISAAHQRGFRKVDQEFVRKRFAELQKEAEAKLASDTSGQSVRKFKDDRLQRLREMGERRG